MIKDANLDVRTIGAKQIMSKDSHSSAHKHLFPETLKLKPVCASVRKVGLQFGIEM